MSAVRVMVAFAAGATIAGMVVGVARLTDMVEPATAAAEAPAAEVARPPAAASSTSTPAGSRDAARPERSEAASAERDRRTSPRAEQKPTPARWRAPAGVPEEVTAGVLARVASRGAKAARCEPVRATAVVERQERKQAKPAAEASSCPPEEGTESVEIDWNGSPATR